MSSTYPLQLTQTPLNYYLEPPCATSSTCLFQLTPSDHVHACVVVVRLSSSDIYLVVHIIILKYRFLLHTRGNVRGILLVI
jgi:hypothetical protein